MGPYCQPGTRFGDCMPIFAEGVFQLFHQRAGPFGAPFGWALARTTDFVEFTDPGEVIAGGGHHAQGQFKFAGL